MSSAVQGAVRDGRGRPVPAITVSDGLHSVRTDAAGCFELAGWGSFVWLSVPTGWACSGWWQRVRGPGPAEFVVHPDPQPLPFRFGHLSDLHLTWGRSGGASMLDLLSQHGDGSSALADGDAIRLRLAMSIANTGIALVVVTGDVTDRGTTGELRAAADLLGRIGVPVRMLPGNHDHYGHLNEPSSLDAPAEDAWMGSATTHRWEETLGPRWWSLGHSGLHFVALDWFSARTGLDGAVQLDWLTGDLAHVPTATPVVILAHDQPDGALMEEIRTRAPHVAVVAALSGHWHTARAVRLDGVLHLATGAGLFGGLDWSAPQTRVLTWDGTELTSALRTTLPPSAGPRVGTLVPQWSAAPARAHSGHLSAHPDGVVVTTADYDAGTGAVGAMDISTGAALWSWAAPHPVASPAAVHPESGATYVQTMAGAVARLDAGGTPRWVASSHDPHRTRVVHPPVLTVDGGVVTGGAGLIRCHATEDGELRWQRPIGRCDTFLTYGTGLATDGLVVLPLGGPFCGLVALRSGDGATVWTDAPGEPGPRSSLTAVGGGEAVVVRHGPVVERLVLGTGSVRWRTLLPGPLTMAPPVVVGDAVIVVTGDAIVHVLDAATGEIRSRHPLGGDGGHGPYRSSGPAVGAGVVATARHGHVITVSGQWWRIDPDGHGPQLVGILPLTVISPPMVAGGRIVVAGADGRVVAMSLDDSGVI